MKVLYASQPPKPSSIKSPFSSQLTSSIPNSITTAASSTNSIFKPLMSLSPIAYNSSASSSFPPIPSPVLSSNRDRSSNKAIGSRKKRKRSKKQFTKTARLLNKISKIKLKWPSKSKEDKCDDIETKNLFAAMAEEEIDSKSTAIDNVFDSDIMPCKQLRNSLSEPIAISKNKMIKKQKQKQQIDGIVDENDENDSYHIDQSLFTFQNPHKSKLVNGNTKKTRSALSTISALSYQRINKRKKTEQNNNKYGYKANGKINFLEISQQMQGLKKLLSEKKTLSEIICIYHQQYGFCIEFIVYLLTTIDQMCPEYIYVVSRHVDKQIKILHCLSLWQYILRHQLPHIDIKRFFYAFGPLIGKYKTLISPLHLSARRLIEIGGNKESHITLTTSTPECVASLKIFEWLLFIGYDIDDGDVDNTITPQTILNHAPRIKKQILSYQRSLLFQQRQCMKVIDSLTYKNFKLLLDDDILRIIEKFTYHKYRKHNRTGFGHKKFSR